MQDENNSIQIIKKFLAKDGNILWVIDNGIGNSIYYVNLMWLPFYYANIGFQKEAAYFVSMFNIMLIPGIFIFNLVSKNIPQHNSFLNLSVRAVRVCVVLALALTASPSANLWGFYLLMGFFGFFSGWPVSFTMST